MTAQQPPFFLADAGIDHDAEGFRRYMAAVTLDGSGIVYPGDMAVSQKSGGANMSVDVAGGRAFIAGDQAVYQGSYFVENRGVRNVTIATADATNPRWDLIVARVRDSAYSGGDDDWDIVSVAGTPAASPAEPALPQNAIRLARVVVDAAVSSIVDANITNQRTRHDAWRAPRIVACTGVTSTTSGTVDITGMTFTLTTPRPNVVAIVTATYDISGTVGIAGIGALKVDGNEQSATAITVFGTRVALSQTWVVTLATAAAHVIKATVGISGTGTVTVEAQHSTLALLAVY